jgi:hypothetical protein
MKLFVITPRREQDLYESIVDTPVGVYAHIYKYYCPLCMEYFRDIFKSACCGNYTCVLCLTQYLGTKGISGPTPAVMLSVKNSAKLSRCPCPHCFTVGLAMELVLTHEDVRDYSRSKDVSDEKKRLPAVSPVKIGDSFEELKRKMLPYQASFEKESKFNLATSDGESDERMVSRIGNISPTPLSEINFSGPPPRPEYSVVSNPNNQHSDESSPVYVSFVADDNQQSPSESSSPSAPRSYSPVGPSPVRSSVATIAVGSLFDSALSSVLRRRADTAVANTSDSKADGADFASKDEDLPYEILCGDNCFQETYENCDESVRVNLLTKFDNEPNEVAGTTEVVVR